MGDWPRSRTDVCSFCKRQATLPPVRHAIAPETYKLACAASLTGHRLEVLDLMRYLVSFGQNVPLASASASRLFAPQHYCFLWDKHSLMEPAHSLRVFRTFQVRP
jgi:hypothetical protein